MSLLTDNGIVTGPEQRQLNGPFKPPIWNGTQPGTREGQHAYDAAGALDGTPGPIWWNGAEWIRYGTGAGTGENIGNTDLTLSDDRTLSGSASNFTLEFNDLGQFVLNTVLTGAGTQQFTNAGATVIEAVSTVNVTSTGNNVIITAFQGISLTSSTVVASCLASGDVNNKKFVVADNAGNLTVQSIGESINVPYGSAVASDDLLTNSFLNGLFPTAAIGTQKVFTNITDAPGNTAIAIMHAASSWSVKLDFIKCS
jgi:hypothetical protein